jgi:hypothetical protein
MIGKKLFYLTFFAIAFGFVESSVVVYLRKIYYGEETLLFPLKAFEQRIFLVELLREAATIIMLIAVPAAVFQKRILRFAGFLWCFAVWDIMYYAFLKFSINWPATILDWDILFLIPIAWASPVLAPVICSLTMMILAGIIFFYDNKRYVVKLSRLQIWLLILGSLVILFSFMQDYGKLFFTTSQEQMQEVVTRYIPQNFNWLLFSAGEALVLFGVWDVTKKLKKE